MHIHFIAVEVCIVRTAVSVMHSNNFLPLHYPAAMRHHGRLVQAGLTIYQDHVSVDQVTHDFALLPARRRAQQLRSQRRARPNTLLGQVNLVPIFINYKAGARMQLWAIDNSLPQTRVIIRCHCFRVRQLFSENVRNTYLINLDVGVGGYDAAASEVDALAHHVHSHQAFFFL